MTLTVDTAPSIGGRAWADVDVTPQGLGLTTAKTDLECNLIDCREADGRAAGLIGGLTYRRDLWTRPTMTGWVARFERVLAAVAAVPEQHIGMVDLLSAAERQQVLVDWNARSAAGRENPFVHAMVATQAAQTPDAIAVVFGDEAVSYGALHTHACQLANQLRAYGVGPEVRVAICLERRIELIVALLGVLHAGGAYVPIEPTHPETRVQQLLEDSAAALVLTAGAAARRVRGLSLTIPVLTIAAELSISSVYADMTGLTPAALGLTPAHLAYVLYTSGSTGMPKGVLVSHAGVGHYLAWAVGAYGAGAALLASSLSFDGTVTSLWLPLVSGGPVVIVAEGEEVDGFAAQVQTWNGALAKITPALALTVGQQLRAQDGRPLLRGLVIGGEALPAATVALWRTLQPALHIWNEYGPTETVVGCVVSDVSDEQFTNTAVSIGQPIADTPIYVLDASGAPVPVGATGELYIGGVQVARGYLGQPGLTAARYVADPFSTVPGARLYRSGDQVRWRADGRLDFLGRRDRQVKLRGVRIELGEIEAALRMQPGVADAVVIACEDTPGDSRLVGYVVAAPDTMLDGPSLRTDLATQLPAALVPSAVLVLPALPLTRHGKVDRAALPKSDLATSQVQYRAPRTPVEEVLCDLVATLLGVSRVGLDDQFFALGGDSIVSIQLVSRARQAGWRLTARDVFEQPRLEGLAARAAPITIAHVTSSVIEESGTLPLTPIMTWLQARGGPLAPFCQTLLVQVPGGLDGDALRMAVQMILDQHDALRLRVEFATPQWTVTVLPRGTVCAADCVRRCDVTSLPAAAWSTRLQREARRAIGRLAPATGVLLQVVWLDAGLAAPGQLLLVGQHLAVDGVSWRILVPQLQAAYEAARTGQPVTVDAPVTSFRHWARWLAEEAKRPGCIAELPYWQDVVAPTSPILMADLDPARDTVGQGAHWQLTLNTTVTSALLTEVPAAFHTGIHEVLLTALAVAVSRWQRQRGMRKPGPVVVAVEGHGRDTTGRGPDLSNTVGWCTSLYPVRLDQAASITMRHGMTARRSVRRSRLSKNKCVGCLKAA